MRALIYVAIAFCVFGLYSTQAMATNASCEEAKALLDKAVATFKAEGAEKAFAKFQNKEAGFMDRDLYVFAFDRNGKFLAHGVKPALIGKEGMNLTDADGNQFIKKFMEVKDSGSVTYRWADPIDNKVKNKTSHLIWVGDVQLGVGCYSE